MSKRRSKVSACKKCRNVSDRGYVHIRLIMIKTKSSIPTDPALKKHSLALFGHNLRMSKGRIPKVALRWTPSEKRTRREDQKHLVNDSDNQSESVESCVTQSLDESTRWGSVEEHG